MADDEIVTGKIIEEAYPSAIRVKEEILNERAAAHSALKNLHFKHLKKLDSKEEHIIFQKQLIGYYLKVSQHFKRIRTKKKPKKKPKPLKIRELDAAIVSKKLLTLDILYKHLCALDKKIYDIKITRIERRKHGETDRF